MEMSLGNFYSSMKWIENATVDLGYQIEEIHDRVNNQSGMR